MLNEKFEVHDTLNPKLWENNNLKSEVREKVLKYGIDEVSDMELLMALLGNGKKVVYSRELPIIEKLRRVK